MDNAHLPPIEALDLKACLPSHRDLYYGGEWRAPLGGYVDTFNPATGDSLGLCAEASAADVDAAVAAASRAFAQWRGTKPTDRAGLLRKVASILRANDIELALIDATNCGGPITAMRNDVHYAATQIELFAGLVSEIKGETVPMGEGSINYTVREPYGVCSRIVAYNHPIMFTAARLGAPLAAGNTVIMKPPAQAPLSSFRMMELLHGVLPPGVLNIITGGRECGEALVAHPGVPFVSLVGSVPTGRAIARSAAEHLKGVMLELGGKNALIVYPDADVARAIDGAIRGMNFTWCGQSCASTSRLFVHESVYEQVVDGVCQGVREFKPGMPTDPKTTMGSIVSRSQWQRVMDYIKSGEAEGARLVSGGGPPSDPSLKAGCFIEPTVFADVTSTMKIAREEIFGPVLSILKWTDEDEMLKQVNGTEYGLTAAIYTRDLATAHRAAARVEAGYVWINNAGPHFPGTSYGGYKQSGIGREESIEELLAFTQIKNVNVSL